MVSMTALCMRSMPTMTHLRLHLSMTLPLKGERNMVTNMEMADMTPIRLLEPVCSNTQ